MTKGPSLYHSVIIVATYKVVAGTFSGGTEGPPYPKAPTVARTANAAAVQTRHEGGGNPRRPGSSMRWMRIKFTDLRHSGGARVRGCNRPAPWFGAGVVIGRIPFRLECDFAWAEIQRKISWRRFRDQDAF